MNISKAEIEEIDILFRDLVAECYILAAMYITERQYDAADDVVENWVWDLENFRASFVNYYTNNKLDFYAKYDLDVSDYCDCGRRLK